MSEPREVIIVLRAQVLYGNVLDHGRRACGRGGALLGCLSTGENKKEKE
jgi:hypothetical protein